MYLAESYDIPESDPCDNTPTAGLKSDQVVPVNLNNEEYELYYNGCCNATFWPLFHSMPDRAIFNQSWWEAYKKVNDNFAVETLAALRKSAQENPNKVINKLVAHIKTCNMKQNYHQLFARLLKNHLNLHY